jgi:hypothetical protein
MLTTPSLNGNCQAHADGTVAEEALRLLRERGLSIIPCDGKRPIEKNWQKEAMLPERLEKLFTERPHLSFGLGLNQSGLIDIEYDTLDGERAVQELFGGNVPRTPTWKSERGLHRLFLRPEGVADTAKLDVAGVEVRGLSATSGAFSFLPPSGGRQWLDGLSIYDVKPAELPAAVVERLRGPAPKTNTGEAAEGDIPEGRRNVELFKIACKMVKAGLGGDLLETSLHAVNFLRCNPPLSEAEVGAIAKSAAKQTKEKPPTHAQALIDLAEQSCQFWHAPNGTAYATISRDGHKENWRLKSEHFRLWLARQFYETEKGAVGGQTSKDVLAVLESKAKFEGEEHPVFLRIAGDDQRIVVDLCNAAWQAVVIDKEGWEVVDDPPVRFRRTDDMLPLPVPERGGTLNELRPFVNVTWDGWVLLLAWLLSAYRPAPTYPILKLVGEQGSAKTTTAEALRKLIDPSEAALLSLPSSPEAVWGIANANWCMAFDNISYLSAEMSDTFCCVSTGGGQSKRRLYTDDEQHSIKAARPLLFTSIEDMGTRSDFMDRCAHSELPEISEDARLSKVQFWAAFEAARPRILAAIFDALSLAIRRLPQVQSQKTRWPRMIDFAQWTVAAEPVWDKKGGSFRRAYARSQAAADQAALDGSLVVKPLLAFLNRRGGSWRGTASELLDGLKEVASTAGINTNAKGWPKAPNTLTGILARLTPNLRRTGVSIEEKRPVNVKVWTISLDRRHRTQKKETFPGQEQGVLTGLLEAWAARTTSQPPQEAGGLP